MQEHRVRTPMRKVVTRKYGLLASDLFIQGLSNPENYKKLLLVDAFVSTGVILDRWYFGQQIRELGEKLLLQEEQDTGFIDRVFANVYACGAELLRNTVQIKKKNFSRVSNRVLIQIFEDFCEQYKIFAVALAGWGLQLPVEARLRAVLKDRPNIENELSILSTPTKKNIVTVEQEELLRIGAGIQRSKISLSTVGGLPQNVKREITTHIEKFGWMTRGGLDETWTPNDVFERLKELVREDCMKKLMDVERQRNKAQDESKKLLRALHADTKLKKLVSIAKELVYYRTYRTDYLNLTLFHVRPLLMEIGRRIGKYSFQQISYFREQEIVRWKPVQRTEIARRMQNFFLFAVNPHACIFTADPKKTKALELEYVEQEKIESNKIKGNAAFLGKVQGRVVMVLSKKDLPKVTRGDILVSTMTTPDYIVAMEKAAAFVTDEGGITCHAAIVAREMKKPCIIGTKIATKVLKDGDRVEVDAAHGLVKKIS